MNIKKPSVKKKKMLLFALIIVFYLIFSVGGLQDGTIDVYTKATREYNLERFVLPLFPIIGFPAYFLLGEIAFTILPIFFFGTAVYFIFRTFELFKLNYYLIFAFFIIHLKGVQTLPEYGRDSLLFVLGAIYLYYFTIVFEKKWKSKKYLATFLIIAVLMYFTKAIGIVFLLMAVFFTLKKSITFNKGISFNGFVLIPVAFVKSWLLNPLINLKSSVSNIYLFTINSLVTPLTFPFFLASILLKNVNSLIWFLVLSVSVMGILSMGLPITSAYRYVYPLLLFGLFYTSYWIKNDIKKAVIVWVIMSLTVKLGITKIYF